MRDGQRPHPTILALAVTLAAMGCGGGNGSPNMLPISVSLTPSTVAISEGGPAAQIEIAIGSTSETALVNFTGLPGGVKVTYAASDTSPSGRLAFTASASAPVGTYLPIITVNSAGETASLQFTLIVSGSSTPP